MTTRTAEQAINEAQEHLRQAWEGLPGAIAKNSCGMTAHHLGEATALLSEAKCLTQMIGVSGCKKLLGDGK